jgi:tRNA pseudouridine55 synthase
MTGPEGILLVDKPAGPTSHDIVAAVRRAFRSEHGDTPKVGHAGTLDPFATGLLVLLVGRATRLAEYASAFKKTYQARVRLGADSTTGDPHGEITERAVPALRPSREALLAALREFVGEQDQIPPAFSAKKVAGRRAYRLARVNAAFTLPPSRITIDSLELLEYDDLEVLLRVSTGPGAYVRALARDLGQALGTGGYLTGLRREAVGPFSVREALAIEQPEGIGGLRAAELAMRLRDLEQVVGHLPALPVTVEEAHALSQGQLAVRDSGLGKPTLVRLRSPAGFLGIGELSARGLRPVKVLYPEGGLAVSSSPGPGPSRVGDWGPRQA